MEYAIKTKVEVAAAFPPVDFAFKYTFCVKADDDGTSILEPVFLFIEEHQQEVKVAVVLFAVVLGFVAWKAGLIAGGIAVLKRIITFILQKVSLLIFA